MRFLMRDIKLRAINLSSAAWERIKDALPIWGFPALFILLGVAFLSVQIVLADKGPPKQEHEWKPEWNKTAAVEESPPVVLPAEPGAGGAAVTTPSSSPVLLTIPTARSEEPAAQAQALSPGQEVPGGNAVFVFKCYGRAHGVGLCMDGVRYRAMAGQSALEIINAYYTGVSVGQCDDSQIIRVKGRDGGIRSFTMKEYLSRLQEEPEDYPAEGLKVLYMAARAYTLSVIARGKHQSAGFDICASGECCQAFDENKDPSGYPNNMAALNATANQALFYGDTPIIAAYCGSCGGHTENNEDVWGGSPIPYLRGKVDPYCSKSPRFLTTKEISASELAGRLGVGELKLVDLSDRTPGGRVRTVKITGSGGQKSISGRALADILGFRNTRYEYSFR